MLSGDIERNQWHEMNYYDSNRHQTKDSLLNVIPEHTALKM